MQSQMTVLIDLYGRSIVKMFDENGAVKVDLMNTDKSTTCFEDMILEKKNDAFQDIHHPHVLEVEQIVVLRVASWLGNDGSRA